MKFSVCFDLLQLTLNTIRTLARAREIKNNGWWVTLIVGQVYEGMKRSPSQVVIKAHLHGKSWLIAPWLPLIQHHPEVLRQKNFLRKKGEFCDLWFPNQININSISKLDSFFTFSFFSNIVNWNQFIISFCFESNVLQFASKSV